MEHETAQHVFDMLGRHRLVPVIELHRVDHAGPLAQALVAGGLPVAEVTFRTAAAAASIKVMADRGDILVGAGTVLTVEQVDQARDAGAAFVVSPGLNPKVVKRCIDVGLPVCPGVATPTEIESALDWGLRVVKFFPAESFGGLKMLKAIAAPYGMMRFMPTGGIGPENVMAYLAFDKVLCCGGSWMVRPTLYADGDFGQVQALTRQAVQQVGAEGA